MKSSSIPPPLRALLGQSVRIFLTHLHYDGRLAARYQRQGRVIAVDDSAVTVRLDPSQKDWRLRPDRHIFHPSREVGVDWEVRAGRVGVGYLRDVTKWPVLVAAPSPQGPRALRLHSGLLFCGFLLLYGIALLCLLSSLSLWLDEILDLRLVRNDSLSSFFSDIAQNGGGVPLGYLVQKAVVAGFGYSRWTGRLPSVFGSVLGCMGLWQLGRRLPLRFPFLAVLLFALSPLQLRYALEARPYSLALALSIWASVLFLDVLRRPTLVRAFWYGGLVLAGLYTQPYSFFVPLTHLAWLLCCRRTGRCPLFLVIGALAVALFGFLPWYVWASHRWAPSGSEASWSSGVGLKTPLLILRELSGAGYPGTLLLLGYAGLGGWSRCSRSDRSLWAFLFLLPILLALWADQHFGYFFAIRQILFVLPPLTLLAARGLERQAQHQPRPALAGGILLLLVLFIGDIQFFRKPREDWEKAAQILQTLAQQGSCLLFVPADSEPLYEFFVPKLHHYSCKDPGTRSTTMAVAISPYGAPPPSAGEKEWAETGYWKQAEYNRAGPRIRWYRVASPPPGSGPGKNLF